MALADKEGFKSIGFPLIGVGETSFRQDQAKAIMEDELGKIDSPIEVRVVFKTTKKQTPWWLFGCWRN